MGPSALLDRISDAIRSTSKLPDIFNLLADAKGKPNGAEAWLAAAKAALKHGEPARCKVLLESWLEQDPHNVAFNVLLSRAYQQLGSPEELDESVVVARAAVSHASSEDDSIHASSQLAVSLGIRARVHTRQQIERQKDRAEASQVLSDLVGSTSTSTSSPTSTSTSSSLASARYALAVLQAEAGQPAAAMASARDALKEAQAGGREPQLTALCLLLVALLISSRRQHKLALSVLSAAPTSASASSGGGAGPGPGSSGRGVALWTDVLVWRLRARLLAAQSDTPGSLAALAHCKKLLAGWAVAGAAGAGPSGVSQGQVEEALAQVWCELAVALAGSGQRAEALAAVDHALALRPWSAPTRTALGAVHEALGEGGAAEAAYGDALALDPTHGPALLRQGALHARRGGRPDLAVARDLLAEALRYDPAAAAAWFQLGRVAASLQHRAEAEAHLLTAVQLASAAPALEYGELPLAPV